MHFYRPTIDLSDLTLSCCFIYLSSLYKVNKVRKVNKTAVGAREKNGCFKCWAVHPLFIDLLTFLTVSRL